MAELDNAVVSSSSCEPFTRINRAEAQHVAQQLVSDPIMINEASIMCGQDARAQQRDFAQP